MAAFDALNFAYTVWRANLRPVPRRLCVRVQRITLVWRKRMKLNLFIDDRVAQYAADKKPHALNAPWA
ncbi:MAG: hypothetical protein JO249_25335 [Acidobacteria bacterium]|nr:hypothetical protein [Acidobacteriota bacterium]MBV9484045.1 hypothetical protein [Acidobacteriota bacterium]